MRLICPQYPARCWERRTSQLRKVGRHPEAGVALGVAVGRRVGVGLVLVMGLEQ